MSTRSYPSSPGDFVLASYRYLRLAIVVVVIALAASLVIERARATCLQGSISSYYYTPVHSIFVGALIAIGVAMVAIKGRDALEDMLFNVAGILAPIVALVPTSRPDELCTRPGDDVTVNAQALIANNVPALAVGSAIAIVMALVIWLLERDGTGRPTLDRAAVVGLALSTLMLIAGVAWYFGWTDSFLRRAHGGTAIAMFVFIWLAVVVNGGWPKRLLLTVYWWLHEPPPRELTNPTERDLRYQRWYRLIAIAMPVGGLAVVVLVDADVRVFWLEVVEIVAFAVFWTLQTIQGWRTGFTVAQPALDDATAAA